ncbi:hypothetical protein GCM10009646_13280 [Streptomyces aureus]
MGGVDACQAHAGEAAGELLAGPPDDVWCVEAGAEFQDEQAGFGPATDGVTARAAAMSSRCSQ